MADAIIAKAKAIYGKRLTGDDYNNLLHKGSVEAVVAYLKTTARYRSTFANVTETQIHRGQVEQMLSKDVFELYIKLCKFMAADKNSFCFFLIKQQEIKQIISAVMFIGSKSSDGYLIEMPAWLMPYVSFDLMALASANDYEKLLSVLSGTPYYKVLRPYLSGTVSSEQLEECGIALYAWYTAWAFKAIERSYKGANAKSLKEIFLRQADLDNLLISYRCRKFYGTDTQTILKLNRRTHYRVTARMLEEILSQPDADLQLISLLKKSYFKNNIDYDPENLEVAVRRYNYSYYKKQLSLCKNGTMALYALIVLCEVERSNIQKIIEGTRYELPPAEIEKLLVM